VQTGSYLGEDDIVRIETIIAARDSGMLGESETEARRRAVGYSPTWHVFSLSL